MMTRPRGVEQCGVFGAKRQFLGEERGSCYPSIWVAREKASYSQMTTGMSGTLSGLKSTDRLEVRNLWRVGVTSGRPDRPFWRKEGARKNLFGRDRAQPLEKAHFAERNGKEWKLLESIFRLSRTFRKH